MIKKSTKPGNGTEVTKITWGGSVNVFGIFARGNHPIMA
jgi:hypothetical protein